LKKIIIIAGPNGAGKTTFARDFLPAEANTLRFINADLIAAGLVHSTLSRLHSRQADSCLKKLMSVCLQAIALHSKPLYRAEPI
jgi:predicted ABC-type ATPase